MAHVIVGVLRNPQKTVLHSYIVDKPDADKYGSFELDSFQLPHYEWEGKVAKQLRGYEYADFGTLCGDEFFTFKNRGTSVEELMRRRRHEIIGWLLYSGERRPHSATIEAPTDDQAVAVARRYSLPPYSWRLRRVHRLDDKVKVPIFDDRTVDDISDDILLGNHYVLVGWLADQSGSEEPDDMPIKYAIRALTDSEAIAKSKHIHPGGLWADHTLDLWRIYRKEPDGKEVVVHEGTAIPATEEDFRRDAEFRKMLRGR